MKNDRRYPNRRSLSFPLDVKDDWPPVGVEGLPFDAAEGGLRLLVPPLYVKDLSVGDIITVRERLGQVSSWKHKRRSGHSTIWLLRLQPGATREINRVLKRVRELGCESSASPQLGSYAIDVPQETTISSVDAVLAKLDPKRVAIAYPSFRHPESKTEEHEE